MRSQKESLVALGASFGRTALRQPVFTMLLLLPPLIGLLIRPLPGTLERLLPAFNYREWIPLFLAVTAGFPPYLFGLLSALMLLDERDRDLLPALRVTPVSDSGLLIAKVLPAVLLSFTGTPLALAFSGQLNYLSPAALVFAALIAAPSAAFYALIPVSLAGNKVQGMTIGKVMGTVLPAPVLLAVLQNPWRRIALIFPSSWTGVLFMELSYHWYWAAGGIIYNTILAVLAWKFALRRYFKL